jgi:5-methyltetrahydrofolate--homocysteine methyltransferase
MQPLLERVHRGDSLVGDGAWGTMLMAQGLRPGVPPETFNLARPEVIEDIARQYVEAGADIITTNTFGGSPLRLRQHGLDESMASINRAAVAAVRRAVGDRAYVSGDIGPCGGVLKPYGDVDPADVAASYQAQARALAEAGVDLFCIETMTDVNEAALAVRAARAVAPAVPIVATLTFDRTPRGFFTVMGVSIARAARELVQAGADIVGSNCGNGIETMVEIARAFRTETPWPLAIQSNAGLPERRGAELVYAEGPEFTAARAAELLAIGVSIVGGCCGTTPAHIRAIRAVVRRAPL